LKRFLRKYLIYLILIPLVYYSCQECDDCGPSQNEPIVNLKFFNIDSLIKVEDTLTIIEDSLEVVNQKIDEGDTTLSDIKVNLENQQAFYIQVKDNINQGKIKIDEVFGSNGEGPLLFKDSLTNDSLTNFRFPLDMNRDESTFVVNIQDRNDEIGFRYDREIDKGGKEIIIRIYNITLLTSSYDSVKVICNKEICTSNETTYKIYF